MRKKLFRKLLTGIVLSVAFTASADTMYLVLALRDGTQSTFALTEKPKVLPDSESLKIVCGDTEITADYEEVDNYTFTNKPAAIESKETGPEMSFADRTVVIAGLKSGTPVTLYSVTGAMLHRVDADSQGIAIINTGNFLPGVLIINTGKASYKILNK